MTIILLASVALAGKVAGQTGAPVIQRASLEAPPLSHATLAPDGTYSLIVQPDTAWAAAEVSVDDDAAWAVGPVEAEMPVRVDGVTSGTGPLHVTVQAATVDDHGVTWSFDVDPELVPVASPHLDRAAGPRRHGFLGLFGHKDH